MNSTKEKRVTAPFLEWVEKRTELCITDKVLTKDLYQDYWTFIVESKKQLPLKRKTFVNTLKFHLRKDILEERILHSYANTSSFQGIHLKSNQHTEK